MTRAFRESEKDRIRVNLLQKGREHFIKYGLKKTSVEELARAAGIAKGSFYKFFDSKEALFLAVHEESEGKIREDALRKLEAVKDPAEKLRTFFKSSFFILEEDPLLQMVFRKDEFASLSGIMTAERYKEHYDQNIVFVEGLIRRWQAEDIIRKLDATVASNMVASVYYIFLQKEALGEEMYARVTDMLSECLASYLVKQDDW